MSPTQMTEVSARRRPASAVLASVIEVASPHRTGAAREAAATVSCSQISAHLCGGSISIRRRHDAGASVEVQAIPAWRDARDLSNEVGINRTAAWQVGGSIGSTRQRCSGNRHLDVTPYRFGTCGGHRLSRCREQQIHHDVGSRLIHRARVVVGCTYSVVCIVDEVFWDQRLVFPRDRLLLRFPRQARISEESGSLARRASLLARSSAACASTEEVMMCSSA